MRARYFSVPHRVAQQRAYNRRYYGASAFKPRVEWGGDEEAAVLTHAVPDKVLAVQLGRSVAAIQIRRSRLKGAS